MNYVYSDYYLALYFSCTISIRTNKLRSLIHTVINYKLSDASPLRRASPFSSMIPRLFRSSWRSHCASGVRQRWGLSEGTFGGGGFREDYKGGRVIYTNGHEGGGPERIAREAEDGSEDG